MRKRLLAILFAATIGLAGCSSNSSDEASGPTEADCGTGTILCIGLVTDTGKVDDKSFNQSAWTGAQNGAAAVGGFAKYIETTDPKDYATNIGLFADQGYDVIIGVGFLMAEAITTAANQYPDIKFIGVDQFQGAAVSNLAGLVFPEDKAGFLAGYLAGNLTTSGKTGAVLGTDLVPPVRYFGEGFRNGVAYAAKELGKNYPASRLIYHAPDNAFNDPAWGAATAQQLLTQGFDVIFGAGGNTGNGALTEIAQTPGAYCIGVDSDQWGTLPEAQPCLVTSAMKLIDKGVESIIKQIADGTFAGGNVFGEVGLAPYHDFESVIAQEIQDKVAALTPKVLAGSVATGVKL
jgi:basic membrane protein A